jgi:hypothetical protein
MRCCVAPVGLRSPLVPAGVRLQENNPTCVLASAYLSVLSQPALCFLEAGVGESAASEAAY